MRKMNADIFIINALLFLLPLVYVKGFLSYDALRYFFFGTTALILTIFTTHRIITNKWLLSAFFKSWYCYGLIIFLFSSIVVSITSVNPTLSFFSSFQRIDGTFAILYFSLFTLSIYSIVAVEGQKVIKQFLISSVLGAVVLSLFIIFSTEGLSILKWNWLVDSRGGAMTGSQSVAGSYALWNIFFAIILFFKSENIKKKILWALSFFILAFSPLFINWHLLLGKVQYTGITSLIGTARGDLLGLVLGFILAVGIWLLLQGNKIKKYIGIGVTSIILIGVVFSGISVLQKSSFVQQKFIEYATDNRLIFWDIAVKGFEERPLFGWGPENFGYVFHKFFNPVLLTEGHNLEVMVDKTHNLFFETLFSGGILLMLALCFFLSTIIAGLIKLAKKKKLTTIEISLLFGALFAWLIQAQFIFESTLSLSMLFLVCGIVYGSLIDKPEIKKQKSYYFSTKEKFIVFLVICSTLILFFYTIALPYKKDRTMDKIYNTNLPLRASLWANLGGISPMGDSSDSIMIFDKIYKTYDKEKQNIRTWDTYKKDIVLKELDAIIDHLSSITNKKDDYDLILSNARISYIRMYIALDIHSPLYNKAQNLLQRAIQLSPTDPQLYWVKVQLETASGNFTEAKNSLEKAFLLEPKSTYTNNLILQFAKSIKDEVYYNFALKRAEENIPGFVVFNQKELNIIKN